MGRRPSSDVQSALVCSHLNMVADLPPSAPSSDIQSALVSSHLNMVADLPPSAGMALHNQGGGEENKSKKQRWEVMARNSIGNIRRQSSISGTAIKEPLRANTDDNIWSLSYLRDRFRFKDLEDLFEDYRLRLRHVLFTIYLMLQLLICAMYISVLATDFENTTPEVLGYTCIMMTCLSLLVYVYNEDTFKRFPQLHLVMSIIIVLSLIITDGTISVFVTQDTQESNDPKKIRFGNAIYMILVVYVFLPISRSWLVFLISCILCVSDILIEMAIDCLNIKNQYSCTKFWEGEMFLVELMVLFCANIVGFYWRFMSEVAFRRAFLDKRGNLESRFKLEQEKKQEDGLLRSILPENIMQKVKTDFRLMIEETLLKHNTVASRRPFPNLYVNRHEMLSILFADIVNFTPLTVKLRVDELVEMLNDLFGKFDEAADKNSCLRIKILGDCYYCVSGVPEYIERHANNCVQMGLDMIDIIREVREERSVNVDMRIGIHSGSVLSGIIGLRKWQFDVWSNDVTIANRMESTGEAGRVHITGQTRALLIGTEYGFEKSDAISNDELLKEENLETFLIIPESRVKKYAGRRISNYKGPSMNRERRLSATAEQIKNLYDGDAGGNIMKVELPPGASGVRRSSMLNRRSSIQADTAGLSSKRRTMFADNSLIAFRRIMGDSKEFMAKAIETMPLGKYDQWFRPDGIHPLFLTFTTEKWGLPFLMQPDPLYKWYLLLSVILFLCTFIMQTSLMIHDNNGMTFGIISLVIMLLLLPFCWAPFIYHKIFDPHGDKELNEVDMPLIINIFVKTSQYIIKNTPIRIFLCLIFSATLALNTYFRLADCQAERDECMPMETGSSIIFSSTTTFTPYTNVSTTNNITDTLRPCEVLSTMCKEPWYFTYCCVMTLLTVWTFFRIHFLIKFVLYIVFIVIFKYFDDKLFNDLDIEKDTGRVPVYASQMESLQVGGWDHLLYCVTIFLALHFMDRQMEYIMRLDFQWKRQLEREKDESETTHIASKLLLQNILPLHVADMYLNQQTQIDELYSESYHHVGVMFASIPNFKDFFKENESIDDGKRCLNVLNEIISDFDMLTYNTELMTMEKIKVVGSTYMAACGLQPGRRFSDESTHEERGKKDNVQTIARFVVGMFEKLDRINYETQQEFTLRVGIDVASKESPVIAGVVGAQKPMYDIWGNTVNVASRMDSFGDVGKMHVTEAVAMILQDLGWNVECRGILDIKGKGAMTTYFVDPIKPVPVEESFSPVPNLDMKRFSIASCVSERSEGRRSSQISVSSSKGLLPKKRGSFDFLYKDSPKRARKKGKRGSDPNIFTKTLNESNAELYTTFPREQLDSTSSNNTATPTTTPRDSVISKFSQRDSAISLSYGDNLTRVKERLNSIDSNSSPHSSPTSVLSDVSSPQGYLENMQDSLSIELHHLNRRKPSVIAEERERTSTVNSLNQSEKSDTHLPDIQIINKETNSVILRQKEKSSSHYQNFSHSPRVSLTRKASRSSVSSETSIGRRKLNRRTSNRRSDSSQHKLGDIHPLALSAAVKSGLDNPVLEHSDNSDQEMEHNYNITHLDFIDESFDSKDHIKINIPNSIGGKKDAATYL